MALDIDIQTLNTKFIQINKPKKTEDSLFGKISYDDTTLNLHLSNIEVVNHKKIKHLTKYYTVLFVKVKKPMCLRILELDNHCIQQVKDHISSWFSKALDENVIEEYYTSSIHLSKMNEYIFKLKLQGSDDIMENGKYDMVITLKGLRFYKQRFIPEWELVTIQPVENDFLNSIDTDDENWEDELIEENVIPEPDYEELALIKDNLERKIELKRAEIEGNYNRIHADLELVGDKLRNIDDLLSKFHKNTNLNQNILDEFNNELENNF
jgi:hypothetical protein